MTTSELPLCCESYVGPGGERGDDLWLFACCADAVAGCARRWGQFNYHRDRRFDQPRGLGRVLGTGIYLRTLRSHSYYMRDREDVQRTQVHIRSRQPPRGFRVRQSEVDDYTRLQQALPAIDAYLSTAPPDVAALHNAMSHWLEVTRGSSRPVVTPFAALGLPSPAVGTG